MGSAGCRLPTLGKDDMKRRIRIAAASVIALVLVVALPAAASAASTLTGETLIGSSGQGDDAACPASYSVSGTAIASSPYPGPFQESGTWTDHPTAHFSANFTITSGTTTITGSKSGTPGSGGVSGSIFCDSGTGTGANAALTGVPYTATIQTPNGNFHDEGVSTVTADIQFLGGATLGEVFTSSLTEPVLIAPTSKDQCKNGGWKAFPQFHNQGQCVSSVQS